MIEVQIRIYGLFLVSIFLAFCTRAWPASISIALAVTICCSSKTGRQYFWLYHMFGWLVPVGGTLIIYFGSSINKTKEMPMLTTEKFGKIQVITSILVLVLCVIVSTFNLIRVVRRTVRLKLPTGENGWVVLFETEDRHLINSEEDEESSREQITMNRAYTGNLQDPINYTTPRTSFHLEMRTMKKDAQLFRHNLLVAFLTIDAFIVSHRTPTMDNITDVVFFALTLVYLHTHVGADVGESRWNLL